MSRRPLIVLLLVALTLGVMVMILMDHSPEEASGVELTGSAAESPLVAWPEAHVLDALSPEEQQRRVGRLLRQAVSAMKARREAAPEVLAGLRELFFAFPPDVAGGWIRSALADPALNASTGITFAVGKDGRLSDAPSLRVALLDWLGQIDAGAAADLAEANFASFSDPDEYAISLRNYAWAHPRANSHDYLRERTVELVTNDAWMRQPSAGLLEAFDVFVHARAVEAADLLVEIASADSPGGRAPAYAAFLTLDRLYQQQPDELFSRIEAGAAAAEGRGPMIAQMIARTDVRQPSERRNLERYLLSPALGGAELEAFAGIFPNHNYMISDNLLTEVTIPDGRELEARDRAAYEWVVEKLGDPRFADRKSELETIRDRLERYLYSQ